MPVDQRGRAAASIAQPLDAEVFADGAWRPGAVLGWRHDESGACEAQVRVALGRTASVRWVDLVAVRLPEPGIASTPPVAAGRADAGPAMVETVVMSRSELRGLLAAGPTGSVAGRRRHASDLTAEVPAIRCTDADPGAGRHRAPAVGGGRHRAADADSASPDAVPAPRAGGSASGPRTRPIRLGDVAEWRWGGSSAAFG